MSTLEERALADSDDSDRFAGTQRDTLTSFIKTSGELVKMTAERDAARVKAADCLALGSAVIERLTTERDAALAALARVDAALTAASGSGRLATIALIANLRAALEPTP